MALVGVVAIGFVGCSTPAPRPGPSVTPTSAPATSSVPIAVPSTGTPEERAAAIVAGLSDDALVGQVLMPAVNLDDPIAGSAALVERHHLAGVILMGNVPADAGVAARVRALAAAVQAAADPPVTGTPLLIGTDQEYGWVTRLKSEVVQLPSAMAFGAAARPDLTEQAWSGAGAELASVGVNVNFAPDADVLGSSGNTIIGSRSFGSDPKAVAAQVRAAVLGLQAAGVAASIKHFPGHGHTTVDSHAALPVLKQSRASLGAADLPPFQAGIDAGAWLVMAGHLDVRSVQPGLPATFAHKVLVDLLRGQLGFTGAVVTDALNMAPAEKWSAGEAAVRALLAGSDLLLMPPDVDAAYAGVRAALRNGRLPRERLVDAVTRVLTVRLRVAGAALDTPLADPAHVAAAQAVAAAAVTVLSGGCTGPLVRGPVRVTASSGRTTQVGWLTEALRRNGMTVTASAKTVVHLVGYGDGKSALVAGAAVTVAMDTPFVLRYAKSKARIATYSSSKVSMSALADVLAGKATASGRSPVAVAGLPRSAC